MASLPVGCHCPSSPLNSSRRGSAAPQRTKRRGTAAVEFAALAPAFFLVVLGLVEVGRCFMVQHLLLNAARQGCRTGILPGNGTTQVKDTVKTALNPSSISTQNVNVTVNGASADPQSANHGDTVTVTVSVAFTDVSWLPFTSYVSGNLSAQYTLLKQ